MLVSRFLTRVSISHPVTSKSVSNGVSEGNRLPKPRRPRRLDPGRISSLLVARIGPLSPGDRASPFHSSGTTSARPGEGQGCGGVPSWRNERASGGQTLPGDVSTGRSRSTTRSSFVMTTLRSRTTRRSEPRPGAPGLSGMLLSSVSSSTQIFRITHSNSPAPANQTSFPSHVDGYTRTSTGWPLRWLRATQYRRSARRPDADHPVGETSLPTGRPGG